MLRVVRVDQPARHRIHSAPEAEGLIQAQGGSRGLARRQDAAAEGRDWVHAASHAEGSLTTRPATADATHSAILPKTTSAPTLPGA